MSSTYRLICLSHDPCLVLGTEWQSANDGHNASEGALMSREGSDEIETHADCDAVIGRWSGGLIQVGYMPYTDVRWIDAEWLRALALVAESVTAWPRGWSADRVRRLRGVL